MDFTQERYTNGGHNEIGGRCGLRNGRNEFECRNECNECNEFNRFSECESRYESRCERNGRGCNHREAEEGVCMVKFGAADVSKGNREIEKAKTLVGRAFRQTELVLKELCCCQEELEKALCHDIKGLREINNGVRKIEADLRRPHC